MGKSAKLHKRTKKTASSASKPLPAVVAAPPQAQAQAAKKKASHKQKRKNTGTSGPILGGADYLTIMSGSRRRAREEAAKLPPDP
ncbi:hypothetical protein MKEN_00928800 [Mycena kentingensis (nom. inval.)]|nr:hypothetical protein MKEN_00928800 [Mycena kentingensis (nom. inval.)]